MANTESIIFLYKRANVPDPIIDNANAMVPNGFTFTFCEMETPDDDRRSLLATADYAMAYGAPFDDIDVATKVKLLQLLSAGYDRYDLAALRDAGIPVASNGGANAPTVAEHAILLMLSVYKKLPLHHDKMHEGEWLGLREALSMRELTGRRVGVVGFGKIGQIAARIAARGFLASVVYYDVMDPPPEVVAEIGATKVSLEELLETSDVVTLHTPLNDATRGLIDKPALERMKPTAILVNTSRGEIVNQADLIAALDAGEIAGAGLDVFTPEPLEADSPLLGRDNVVVTPHTAGTTIDTWTRRLDFAFENIQRVAAGEAPTFVVNG
ncbi:MAG: 2-hydroxyacid dehydrogenase [Alphaproteobacteria bacterium]|nr:2-hydroxyacid dehydrogenase [Alphaproteobacteria bacterium]